jgi:hypothetical protein
MRVYQWRQAQYWTLSVSTQLPTRSSPFVILTLLSLHSLVWQPARLLGESSRFHLVTENFKFSLCAARHQKMECSAKIMEIEREWNGSGAKRALGNSMNFIHA